MYKSVAEGCLDKKFRLSSFEKCWGPLLSLLMTPRSSLLQIDKVSLLETFDSLKIRNFRYTPSCLQLLRKSMTSFVCSFCTLVFHIFGNL